MKKIKDRLFLESIATIIRGEIIKIDLVSLSEFSNIQYSIESTNYYLIEHKETITEVSLTGLTRSLSMKTKTSDVVFSKIITEIGLEIKKEFINELLFTHREALNALVKAHKKVELTESKQEIKKEITKLLKESLLSADKKAHDLRMNPRDNGVKSKRSSDEEILKVARELSQLSIEKSR